MRSKNVNCLSCGADNGEVILDRESPRHVICRQCGFVYMNPVPDLSDNQDYYNSEYWESHHNMSGPITEYPVIPRQRRLLEWIKPYLKPDSKVIEIGCGYGFNLDYLKKETGIQPEGLEASIDGCNNTRNAFGIHCHHGFIEDFKPEYKYQVAILSHVLEHFENPQGALDLIAGILEEGGVIWVEVPNILFPNPSKNLSLWLSREHISYFSPGKLKLMLNRAGFRVLKTENDFYTCIMAVKDGVQSEKPVQENEYRAVKNALRKHALYYKTFRALRKFGINIFRKYSLKAYRK